MNWRTVDMSRESRRDQFAYFQTLSNPYVGVTVQVDVTELAVWCRESGTSFFLAVLYAAVRAANGVPELRRRIRGDQVVEYDRCPSSHTVALPDGTYCYCSLEVDRPFRGVPALRGGGAGAGEGGAHPGGRRGRGEPVLCLLCPVAVLHGPDPANPNAGGQQSPHHLGPLAPTGGPDSAAYDAAGQPRFGGRHPHRPVL